MYAFMIKNVLFAKYFRRFPNLFFFSSPTQFSPLSPPSTIPHKLRLKEDPPLFLFSLSFSRIFFFFPLPIRGEKKCRRIKKGGNGEWEGGGITEDTATELVRDSPNEKILLRFFTAFLPRCYVLEEIISFPHKWNRTKYCRIPHLEYVASHVIVLFPFFLRQKKGSTVHKKVQKQVSNFFSSTRFSPSFSTVLFSISRKPICPRGFALKTHNFLAASPLYMWKGVRMGCFSSPPPPKPSLTCLV